MSGEKYVGLEVHQATISVAVMDSRGKLVMESILETKAATILEFFAGLRGTLSVTFEEGTWGCLVVRSAQAAGGQVSVVQPAQKRTAQTWQQKRQDRCPQTGRSLASQRPPAGLSRRDRRTHAAGTRPKLSDHRQRSFPGDESVESAVS